jgi:hypothetical protein
MKKLFISCLAFLMLVFGRANAQTCSSVNAGSISSDALSYNLCNGDELPDVISVTYTNKVGPNSRILLIDNATIKAIYNADQVSVNFEGNQSFFTGYFRGITYENGLSGLVVGQTLTQLVGCYALSSNTVFITLHQNEIGTITMEGATTKTVCVDDGKADLIKFSFSGSLSTSALISILDDNNNIISQAHDLPILEGTGAGTIRFVVIGSCSDEGDAVPLGTNLSNLPAVNDASQILTINKITGCATPPVCAPEQKACPGKVLMCVNNVSTCVATNKVNRMLSQGATLGGCIRCTTSNSGSTNQPLTHTKLAYPNPSHGLITINSSFKGRVLYELYNQENQKVWEAILDDDTKDRSLNFSNLGLKSGKYLIRMSQGSNTNSQRLIFE